MTLSLCRPLALALCLMLALPTVAGDSDCTRIGSRASD